MLYGNIANLFLSIICFGFFSAIFASYKFPSISLTYGFVPFLHCRCGVSHDISLFC